MSAAAMMDKIRSQPRSLAGVLEYQCGSGAGALTRAAELLRSRRQVVITGMGASFFAALPLEAYLCSLGIDAIAVEAGELLHYRHQAFREAVVVAVSRSGESIEIVKLLAILKGRLPVIGVCNRAESLLSREADIAISIASMDDDVVALQTYTGTMLTLYLLGHAVADLLSKAKSEIEGMLPQFAEVVDTSLRDMAHWDDFLHSGCLLYLLARGPSCASAFEGALLFNEVAKYPALAMTAGSFRHGPVEVVDSTFHGVIFASGGITTELNVALAGDLARFGGQLRLIGPAVAEVPGVTTIKLPEVPEMLAPLFEVVPIQVAALRLAELRGIVPGSFRFVSPVTLDETNFSQMDRNS